MYKTDRQLKKFVEKAKSRFQQIENLIAKYQRLDTAIIYLNDSTLIEVNTKLYSMTVTIAFQQD